MSLADYQNVEKLTRLFDWAVGLVFSLVKLGVWLLLCILLAVIMFQ
jgi:hypothetical protein